MNVTQKIKLARAYANISEAELSRRFGAKSAQVFNSRLKTGKFTSDELDQIAHALGAEYYCGFRFPDGTEF